MTPRREHLVFVHGLWMTGLEALAFRRRMQGHGYSTSVFSYRTTREPLERTVARLHEAVNDLQRAGEFDRVHFVGHSLGGIVTLAYFERHAERTPPGRVLLLGSPVQGSAAARRLRAHPIGRGLLGPAAGAHLTDDTPRRWHGHRDLGVIAGTLAVGFGRWIGGLPEPNDGTVALAETDLPGARDTLHLPVGHMGMLVSRRVIEAAAGFLRDGHFPLSRRSTAAS